MNKFQRRIDMTFQYTPASKTNIAKTFERERKRLADEAAKREAEAQANQDEITQKLHRISRRAN